MPQITEHMREGFEGQKMIVIPQKIISQIKSSHFYNSLYLTDIGYFPKAKFHYRERPEGNSRYILIYCTEGLGWFEFGDTRYSVKPDDYFILPPCYGHSYGADQKNPWSIYWIHFSGKAINYPNSDPLPLTDSLHGSVYHIQDRIKIFNEMYRTLEGGYSMENIGYANSCLWHFLGSFLYRKAFKKKHVSEHADPIENSISWMQKNLGKQINLDELAEKAHYSVSHYSTLFHKKTGCAPIDYFIHLKMQKACQYLDLTDLNVKEIANQLGYSDPYYFSRIFHKTIGTYPTKYRKKEKG